MLLITELINEPIKEIMRQKCNRNAQNRLIITLCNILVNVVCFAKRTQLSFNFLLNRETQNPKRMPKMTKLKIMQAQFFMSLF
jgi:hypothetical protein